MNPKTLTSSHSRLLLEGEQRVTLWSRIATIIEKYIADVTSLRVAPEWDLQRIRTVVETFDFESPRDPIQILDVIADALSNYQVHTPHPRYFGLFNPAPATMGIAADTLVAAFNPQLAAWSHSPFAAEIERHLVRSFAARFGWSAESVDGTFASGGAEANHTALITALVNAFPAFSDNGVRALRRQPVLYLSAHAHDSLVKAARFCGLGTAAVRQVAVDDHLQLDIAALESLIKKDRQAGFAPFMIAATAGTTNAGVIDPLPSIGRVAKAEKLWLHVDAAWGGAAVFVPELRTLLDGIELADSITFDAHKFLSVPMGAGIYLTRHPDILARACGMATDYMPRDAKGMDVVDPFAHSMQWSRRFTGLKVLLPLAVAGWSGYEAVIRHQVEMGELLRRELIKSGWRVMNKTLLPVVCFAEKNGADVTTAERVEAIAKEVVSSGKAWISTTRLGETTFVLRACITNFRTNPDDISALVDAVSAAAKVKRQK